MLKVVQANLPEHRVLIFGVSRLNAKQRVFAHSDHMFMHRFQLRMLIPITYNDACVNRWLTDKGWVDVKLEPGWAYNFNDSGEYEELCWASQTAEPGYAITYKAMLQRDNGSRLFIHGHDEPQVRADNSGPIRSWKFAYIERTAAVDMFLAHYKVPNAMWFDANLMASYITAPAWLKVYANEYPLHIWDPEMIKHDLLPPAFPGLKLRPKRHGFEDGLRMVVETRHRWLAKVRELSGIDWMQITYEPVESVLRKLGCK